MQLLSGFQLDHREKLKRNIGVLIKGGLPDSEPEREQMNQIIDDVLNSLSERGSFVLLEAIAAEAFSLHSFCRGLEFSRF